MTSLRLAFSLLTVLPVPGPARVDRRSAGRAMALAPLVGVVLGLLAGVVVISVRLLYAQGTQTTPLLAAVAGIATLALLTRGLHLDGLADVTDGLGASHDPARSLAVMKRSDIGAFGVAALVFVVLAQVTAFFSAIVAHHGTVSLVLAATTGRLAATLACVPGIPAARAEGLGTMVAGSVRPAVALSATTGVLGLAVVAGLIDFHGGGPREAVRAVVAVLAALAVTSVLARWFSYRLGGITGDVLGALVEIATLVTLLAMAVHLPARVSGELEWF